MKAMKIVTMICWMITAVALTGILVFFLTGTVFGFSSDKWDFGNSFGINLSGWTENLTGPFEVDDEYFVKAENIQSLRINWVSGNVSVNSYNGDSILITELAQRELSDKEKLSFNVSGDTLTINFRERGSNSFRSMPRKQLEVYIPQHLTGKLDKLTIDTVSGDVSIDDSFYATTLKCESVSGEIKAKGFYDSVNLESVSGSIFHWNSNDYGDVTANTVSGTIELHGAFRNVKVETVSGRMTVSSVVVPSSFKSDSVSGSLTIRLPAGSSISVNHSAVSGKLSSDLPTLMEGRGAVFTISSVSGSTKIEVLG